MVNKKTDFEIETRNSSGKRERIDGGSRNSFASHDKRGQYEEIDVGRPSGQQHQGVEGRQSSKRSPRQMARPRRNRHDDNSEQGYLPDR